MSIVEWFPDNIKTLRKNCKLSRRELGRLVGSTDDYIASVEKGLKKPCMSLKILLDYLENQLKIYNGGNDA